MRAQRRHIKNCPICRLAMVASKSSQDSADFDRFDCLRCQAVISLAPDRAKPKGGGSASE
jgi:hypothetical protein